MGEHDSVQDERRRSSSRGRQRSRSRERRNGSRERNERERSKSRSKSPGTGFDPNKERRRPTWFDIQPIGGAPPPISQLPGAVQVVPDELPASLTASTQGGANQQATRHARRIYVGGLPPSAREENIASFIR